MRSGGAISMIEFSADLRYVPRLVDARSCKEFKFQIWREAESVDPRALFLEETTISLLPTKLGLLLLCHATLAKPMYPCLGIFFLNLPEQVMRNASRSRLRAHTLKVKPAVWQDGISVCDGFSCNQTQDEAHALFNCSDEQVCSLKVSSVMKGELSLPT
eukprot:854852-Pelagomonas_calceolata.AAC.1